MSKIRWRTSENEAGKSAGDSFGQCGQRTAKTRREASDAQRSARFALVAPVATMQGTARCGSRFSPLKMVSFFRRRYFRRRSRRNKLSRGTRADTSFFETLSIELPSYSSLTIKRGHIRALSFMVRSVTHKVAKPCCCLLASKTCVRRNRNLARHLPCLSTPSDSQKAPLVCCQRLG